MEKTLNGQVSIDQIEAWKKETKAKYGDNHKVYKYEVDGCVAYFRSVDRDTFAAATSKLSSSPAKFSQYILEKTWLGGDESIRKDDSKYFGLN